MAEMSNKKKDLNVPPLRFPEFKGEWHIETIGNSAPLQRGFDLPESQIKPGNVPVVYSNGILRHNNEGKVEGPGVITGRSGTIGKFTFIESGKYWPHNTTLWVTDFVGNDPLFIYYVYQTISIEHFASGSGVPTLNRNDVMAKQWSLPDIKEQSKIAKLLSLIDCRIELQRKTIEDYRNLLDWVIGRIFNWHGLMNGEPKAKLKQLLVPSSKEGVATSLYKKATIKLHLEGMTWFDGTRQMKDTRPFYVRHAGEIIIGKQNYFNGSVAIVPKEFDGCVCSNAIMSFSISPSINQTYLFFAVANKEFLQERSYWANGTGQKELSERDFLNFEISIPPLKKQNQIGDVINKLQNKIDTEIMILEKLERGREFLLNSLFA